MYTNNTFNMTAHQDGKWKSNSEAQSNIGTPCCELKGICYEFILCVGVYVYVCGGVSVCVLHSWKSYLELTVPKDHVEHYNMQFILIV